MSDSMVADDGASPGISVEVLAAAGCLCVSGPLAAGASLSGEGSPSFLLLVGWPVFAVCGGIVLDRRPGSPVGRALAALSLLPLLVAATAVVRGGALPFPDALAGAASDLAAAQATALTGLLWAFRRPNPVRHAWPAVALAVAGSLLTATGSAVPAGWALVSAGCAGLGLLIGRATRFDERLVRRRVAWMAIALLASAAAVAGAVVVGPDPAAVAVALCLPLIAVTAARLDLSEDLRPLDEPGFDALLAIAALAAAGAVAGVVWLGADLAGMVSPGTPAAVAAVLTLGAAVPAAGWLRRAVLARRYGTGLLSPADVAVITAGMHARTKPRDLLDKAARMVAAASGTNQARIVLGDDVPAVPPGWIEEPLLVACDRVGTLLVDAGRQGPEARQRRAMEHLLPTVALVARAVGLAVEAEHARRDVARERQAERARILAELHDGLGPVLAGMSMRVGAAMRTNPPAPYDVLLADLAGELAAGRTDLRGIVAGLTPSALEDGDLGRALRRLVGSFQAGAGQPRVTSRIDIAGDVAAEVQIAVYRSVAEGLTNALRHGHATAIDVDARAGGGTVRVEVVDDGVGGPVVPGVGLASLRQRAESLGGRLTVEAAQPRGTRLALCVPTGNGSRA